jgi:uncharacterized protein (TIGR02246 family)
MTWRARGVERAGATTHIARNGHDPHPDPLGTSGFAREGDRVRIRDELDAINAGFGEAFATQDAERLADFYADDARLLFHGQPIIRGRAAVDAALRDMVAGGPASLRFVTDEVIEDGSLVVDIGRIVGPGGQSKYVVVYQRQADGSLRIVVDAVSSNGP